MPTIITPKSEAEWLELRTHDITSTEVSALFGLSPYMTEYELYHVKTGQAEDSFKENTRTKWGKRLEGAIAKGVAEDLDINIVPYKHYVRHSDEPHMGSSFDFRIVDHPKGDGNFEIKNVDGLIWKQKWSDDEAPDHIELQVQHQMEVADVEWTLICALVGGNEPKFIYRDRDREVGAGLRAGVGNFWQKVADEQVPIPDYAKDADFIVGLHQSAGGAVLESEDEGLATLMKDYQWASKVLKEYEADKKECKARVLEHIGNDYSKVLADRFKLHCGMVKGKKGTLVTEDMVGTTIGASKPYRGFKLYEKEE
jgi:putative phage-type endonuclease